MILFPLTLSFGAGKPVWVDSWQDNYPESIYLGAVGSGESRESAEKNAYSNLASYFGVSVDSVTKMYSASTVSGSGDTSSTSDWSSFKNKATLSIKISDIAGAAIAESWYDGKTYFALALLNKNSAVLYYFNQAVDAASEIAYYQTIDPSSLSFSSIGSVQSLRDKALKYYEAARIISVLSPGFVDSLPSIPSDSDILYLIDKFTYELSVEVCGESDGWYMISGNVYGALDDVGIKPAKGESRYRLEDSLELTETTLSGNPLKFIKYSLVLKIVDNETGRFVFTWSISGREGQTSFNGARERAFIVINKKIENELPSALKKTFAL